MKKKILKEYQLGDMLARYQTDENERQVSLMLLPNDFQAQEYEKEESIDSLVQYKLVGDIYDEAYALGNSMRNSESVRMLALKSHEAVQEEKYLVIKTVLEDARGYEIAHVLKWKEGTQYVKIHSEFKNNSKEQVNLEMFESFSISGLTPYLKSDAHEGMKVHRIRSVWSGEGRWEKTNVEDLQLEPAWAPHAVRCEKFGQVGSMPVNKFFPFVAVEDKVNHVFWGAQIAHNASWQMELYRKDDALCVSGGLADRDFGHWFKQIAPGLSFNTPTAILSVAATDNFDVFTKRIVDSALEYVEKGPEIEKELPIIFNEYCTTWGNPSHKNISEIIKCIKDKGFRYFVIDCGWYKEAGVPWDISMGDYEVSKELFPQGLDKTVEEIRNAGMIPGIWFEIENVGKAAQAYNLKEHLLHKDGKVLTSYFRRFWDMKQPWVQQYLSDKVIGTLKKYNFGYMKIDYNETIGIGCDGTESLGEGLRQNMEASAEFFELVKKEVPDIILENCASGGHRLEPGLMGQMSMASFSDAHEGVEIPIIAADLHRVIHPCQSQIWAVIREADSLQRIAYSIANTFLGRMCVSGDVTNLRKSQWNMITRGMEFYKKISGIIKEGQSYRFGEQVKSIRHPEGWQALLRIGNDNHAFIVVHTFGGTLPEMIEVTLPSGYLTELVETFSDTEENVVIKEGKVCFVIKENWKTIAVRIK